MQPSADDVVRDLQRLMARSGDALNDECLASCRSLIAVTTGHADAVGDEDILGSVRAALLDVVARHGSDNRPAGLPKKEMTPANQIMVVARAIRLWDTLPINTTDRRKAATKHSVVSEGIFRSDRRAKDIDRYCRTFADALITHPRDGEPHNDVGAAATHHERHPIGATSDHQSSATAVPGAWERLAAMSQRLAEEIDRAAEADRRGALRLSQGAYVERSVEASILQRLRSGGDRDAEIVVGEAGDGKTTLLWSLHRKLDQDRHPLLLSAVWFQPDDRVSSVLTAEDVLDAVQGVDGVIVLLDTADLLLHSEFTAEQTIALIERLTILGVPTVVSTRPREALSLPVGLGRRTDLGAYSDTELAEAVPKLVRSYCLADTEAPADVTSALKQARARGLVVERVCSSPLLLRLLFDLASPHFPRLEIDVTGLYRQYWERRVVTDVRAHGRGTAQRKGADLSTAAGLIGIVMVAAGRPEVKVESAIRRATEAASTAAMPVGPQDIREAIDALCQRGVLIETAGSIRFLHQTLFEFAAAQGIASRGNEREVPRLLLRLEESPDDLFLGAVVEQLLILLADDELAQESVAEAVRRLSASKQPSLVEIAMLVWAHYPALPGVRPQDLDTVHPEAIERFIRVVPSVHNSDGAIVKHLTWIWDNRKPLRPKVVDACAYLGRRSPARVAKFVAAHDVFGELADRQRKMVRANPTPLMLLELILAVDPDYAHPAVLDLMSKLASDAEGKATIASCLRLIASQWAATGSPPFLIEVENAIEAIQKRSHDSDAKLVREALAEVIASHWLQSMEQGRQEDRQLTWENRLRDLCTALEDIPIRKSKAMGENDSEKRGPGDDADDPRGDQSPVLGARLIAVARIVAAMTPGDPRISDTLDQLFGLRGPAASRQLARGSIAYLLIGEYPATDIVIERLGALLAAQLPADYNTFEPGPELWSAVARSCLMDSRIPAERVVAVTAQAQYQYPDSGQLWTRRDMLLGLAPAAIAVGVRDAANVFARISDGVLPLPDIEKNIFLDNAIDRVEQTPESLAPLTIRVARSVGRPATVRALADVESARPVLHQHAADILGWIDELLAGPDNSQGDGARLLLSLVRNAIAAPDFEQLVTLYSQLTHPEAKADLVRAIGSITLKTDLNDDAIAFLRKIIRTTRHPAPTIGPAPARRLINPVIVDAARDALLEAFGFETKPTPPDWDTVFALTFAPRLSGSREVDMTGAGNLSLYLTHLTERGHVHEASQYLIEVIHTLAQLPATRQARLGSNRLRVAIGTIVRKSSDEDLHALLATVEIAPPALSALLIRAAVRERYDDVREMRDRLAEHPTMGHEVAKAQNSRVRIAGRQTFAEMISPV